MREQTITETTIEWQGIKIQLRHTVDEWKRGRQDIFVFDHLEVFSIEPRGQPLPITETGYHSNFILPEVLAEHGGVVAFVTALLDHEAQSRKWQTARQLSLF